MGEGRTYGTSTVTSPKVTMHHWTCALTLAASSTLLWHDQVQGNAFLIMGARAAAHSAEGEVSKLTQPAEPSARQRRAARLAAHGVTLDMIRADARSTPITWMETSEEVVVPPADVWDVSVDMNQLRLAREQRKAARRVQLAGDIS